MKVSFLGKYHILAEHQSQGKAFRTGIIDEANSQGINVKVTAKRDGLVTYASNLPSHASEDLFILRKGAEGIELENKKKLVEKLHSYRNGITEKEREKLPDMYGINFFIVEEESD